MYPGCVLAGWTASVKQVEPGGVPRVLRRPHLPGVTATELDEAPIDWLDHDNRARQVLAVTEPEVYYSLCREW